MSDCSVRFSKCSAGRIATLSGARGFGTLNHWSLFSRTSGGAWRRALANRCVLGFVSRRSPPATERSGAGLRS
eukprot:scaffold146_cov265-Pinguiococcus_pyrenoidosus.AAC.1